MRDKDEMARDREEERQAAEEAILMDWADALAAGMDGLEKSLVQMNLRAVKKSLAEIKRCGWAEDRPDAMDALNDGVWERLTMAQLLVRVCARWKKDQGSWEKMQSAKRKELSSCLAALLKERPDALNSEEDYDGVAWGAIFSLGLAPKDAKRAGFIPEAEVIGNELLVARASIQAEGKAKNAAQREAAKAWFETLIPKETRPLEEKDRSWMSGLALEDRIPDWVIARLMGTACARSGKNKLGAEILARAWHEYSGMEKFKRLTLAHSVAQSEISKEIPKKAKNDLWPEALAEGLIRRQVNAKTAKAGAEACMFALMVKSAGLAPLELAQRAAARLSKKKTAASSEASSWLNRIIAKEESAALETAIAVSKKKRPAQEPVSKERRLRV